MGVGGRTAETGDCQLGRGRGDHLGRAGLDGRQAAEAGTGEQREPGLQASGREVVCRHAHEDKCPGSGQQGLVA